jgi:hypothetical protein
MGLRTTPRYLKSPNFFRVGVTQAAPRRLIVRALRTDPLAEPFGPQRCPPGTYLPHIPDVLYVGRDDFGNDRYLPLRGLTGICVSGLPGYGKTSLIASWLCQLTPTPRRPVRLLDGKDGGDQEPWHLRAWRQCGDLQDLEREAAANLWEDHDAVFAQENGHPIDPRADWQEWSDILAEAGIPHVGTHTMRHSAATIALDQGVALAVVQEMLGHSDIRVTRGYTHVSSLLAQDAAARLGQALFGETATKTATRSLDH